MMYLLYKKFKNSEKVVEADILNIVSKDDKTYSFYNQKIQEENSKKNSAFEYVIKEVEDDSLIAFLALDRKYDMEKFNQTASDLYDQINHALETAIKLDVFYREGRDNTR